MLTYKELHKLIELTRPETVAEFDKYKVTVASSGYHKDLEIAALQAKLSIMLKVAQRQESDD